MKKTMKRLASILAVFMMITLFPAGVDTANASQYYYFKSPQAGKTYTAGTNIPVSFYAGVTITETKMDKWGNPAEVIYHEMPITLKVFKGDRELFSQEYKYTKPTTIATNFKPNTAGTLKLCIYGQNMGLNVTSQTLQDTITIKVRKPAAKKVKKIKPKISVDRTSKKSAQITCENDSGFGMKIYRATKKGGKYKLIKTTKKSTFTDKKLSAGKVYYYKVRLYAKSGKKTLLSKWSSKVKADKYRPGSGNLKLSYSASSGVRITWKPINGAGFYLIGKSTSGVPQFSWDNQYICCGKDELTYYDKEVEKGKTYYYAVFAMNDASEMVGKHASSIYKITTK